MFDRIKHLACFILIFSLLCIPTFDNCGHPDEDVPTTLSDLPADITLAEALKRYPQLQEIYPVRIISAEEGAELIAQGVTPLRDQNGDIIYGDDILAVPLLSQLNAVKKPPVSQVRDRFP